MNENERTPAETAADYAVHFADGFFVPCPCCGKEVESPDNGFTSEKEAMEWALGACDCAGAKAWQQQRPVLRTDSPCVAGKMKAGRCGHSQLVVLHGVRLGQRVYSHGYRIRRAGICR